METDTLGTRWSLRLAYGLVAGAAIAAVDNFAFGGEVSPIVIVLLLLVATGLAGALWGMRACIATLAVWAWVPGAHVVKHLLGLPDTLQPNTYKSILLLAIFTLVVSAIGTGCGVLVHRFAHRAH